MAAVTWAAFASVQQVQTDTIPVKNWSMPEVSDQVLSSHGTGAAGGTVVFVAVSPCRVMNTRRQTGSGKTGLFGHT